MAPAKDAACMDGSHKGCRYMIHVHVFVAAPLVGAIFNVAIL